MTHLRDIGYECEQLHIGSLSHYIGSVRQKKNLPTSWTARPGCGSALRSAVVEPATEVITPKNPRPSV